MRAPARRLVSGWLQRAVGRRTAYKSQPGLNRGSSSSRPTADRSGPSLPPAASTVLRGRCRMTPSPCAAHHPPAPLTGAIFALDMLCTIATVNQANCTKLGALGRDVLLILDAAGALFRLARRSPCTQHARSMHAALIAILSRKIVAAACWMHSHSVSPAYGLEQLVLVTQPCATAAAGCRAGRKGTPVDGAMLGALAGCFDDCCTLVDGFSQPGETGLPCSLAGAAADVRVDARGMLPVKRLSVVTLAAPPGRVEHHPYLCQAGCCAWCATSSCGRSL
jgi:hypothetical protein